MNMQMQSIDSKAKNGLRELTSDEIMAVSGGGDGVGSEGNDGDDIVVTGHRRNTALISTYAFIPHSSFGGYDFTDRLLFSGGGGDYGFDGGGFLGDLFGEDDEISEEEKKILEGELAALEDALKEDVRQNGGDFTIKVGDVSIKASELIKGLDNLGKLLLVYDAAQLTNDIFRHDASIGQVVGFLTGWAIAAGLVASGAGAITVFAVVLANDLLVPNAVNGFARQVDNALVTMRDQTGRAIDTIIGAPSSDFDPVDMINREFQSYAERFYNFFYLNND